MRICSQPGWRADGSNPSPVRQRLKKAPSPDTLSPRERAICPAEHPRCPAKDAGHCSAQGGEGPEVRGSGKIGLSASLLDRWSANPKSRVRNQESATSKGRSCCGRRVKC
jgi:hypothetical protein